MTNLLNTFPRCWAFAQRRAHAAGDTYHVIATGDQTRPRIVLSDCEMFNRDDITPEDIEATADPFLDLAHDGTAA